jgi:L-iditol 2-dehydrogenase
VPDARARTRLIRDWTDGRGADIVIEVSGGATAFPEGIAMVRRGGRYLVIGQVGGHEVSLAPRYIVEKQLTVLGVMSGDTEHYYRSSENKLEIQDWPPSAHGCISQRTRSE